MFGSVHEVAELAQLENPLRHVRAGLQAEDGSLIGLQSVHVRGTAVDLIASCTLFQVYRNTSHEHVEAKYVFPLDESAAVCGFEAYIGSKHVVGVVKEKQQVCSPLFSFACACCVFFYFCVFVFVCCVSCMG